MKKTFNLDNYIWVEKETLNEIPNIEHKHKVIADDMNFLKSEIDKNKQDILELQTDKTPNTYIEMVNTNEFLIPSHVPYDKPLNIYFQFSGHNWYISKEQLIMTEFELINLYRRPVWNSNTGWVYEEGAISLTWLPQWDIRYIQSILFHPEPDFGINLGLITITWYN